MCCTGRWLRGRRVKRHLLREREPPESLGSTIGEPVRGARSSTLRVFSACASDSAARRWSRDDLVVRNALSVEAEIPSAVSDECIKVHKRVGIQQDVKPFADRQLALLALTVDPLPAAPKAARVTHRPKLLDARQSHVSRRWLLLGHFRCLCAKTVAVSISASAVSREATLSRPWQPHTTAETYPPIR